jgi:glycosyltransferase involved in cell wall biosynthesis
LCALEGHVLSGKDKEKTHRIGLHGFRPHFWRSVNRTRSYWEHALRANFHCVELNLPIQADQLKALHAVVSFSEGLAPISNFNTKVPRVIAMHGGVIVDHYKIRARISDLRTCDRLVVNCKSDIGALNFLFGHLHPQTRLLPLPVDTSVFRPLERARARSILSLPKADFVLGFVARLLPQKNLHGFLRIVELIQARAAPVKLGAIIVGSYWKDYRLLGYSDRQYDEVVQEIVNLSALRGRITHFPGGLSDESLVTVYSAMDLLVHPTQSIDENFGYVPLEAMACGTPVLAAAYGGLKDTTISGRTGRLMPTWISHTGLRMDQIAGIEFAERFFDDANLRKMMSAGAVRHVRSHYSYKRFQSVLADTVREAIFDAAHGSSRASKARGVLKWRLRGELPAIAEPWEKYEPVVIPYVSGPAPEVMTGSRLALAAPLVWGQSTVKLNDPTWPAVVRISAAEASILSNLEPYGCIRIVTVKDKRKIPVLQRLVRRGLVISSNPAERERCDDSATDFSVGDSSVGEPSRNRGSASRQRSVVSCHGRRAVNRKLRR